MNAKTTIRLAALVGFLGVTLGAFGAHGLEHILQKHERVDTWETAVLYHLIHAVALLTVGLFPRAPKGVVISFLAGVILFSGSLYLLSVTNVTWLGAITPLGGVAFLVGWAMLVVSPATKG